MIKRQTLSVTSPKAEDYGPGLSIVMTVRRLRVLPFILRPC